MSNRFKHLNSEVRSDVFHNLNINHTIFADNAKIIGDGSGLTNIKKIWNT